MLPHVTTLSFDCIFMVGRGGLGVKAKMAEQKQWNGQGSPPRQCKKATPPYQQHCLTDYEMTSWLCVCLYMCVYNHWVTGRVASRIEVAPVKIRILYTLSFICVPVSVNYSLMKAAVGCQNVWLTVPVFWLAQRIDQWCLHLSSWKRCPPPTRYMDTAHTCCHPVLPHLLSYSA